MLKRTGSLMLSLITIALLADAAAAPPTPLPLNSPCYKSVMEHLAAPGSQLAQMATPPNVPNPEFTANHTIIILTDHALDMSRFPRHVQTYGAWLYLQSSPFGDLIFLDQSIRGYPRDCFATAISKDELILPSS